MTITVSADAAGQRLDQFLAAHLPDTSRARVQQLMGEEKALVTAHAQALAEAAWRRADHHSWRSARCRRCAPWQKTFRSTSFMKTTILPW